MRGRIQRQVEGILEGNGLRWNNDEQGVVLRFDSALVHVGISGWGAQNVLQLRSDVLREVPSIAKAKVLERLNVLNCGTSFGKWAFYEDESVIALEYDLLADHLQEAELMTALAVIARLADNHDDQLQAVLGGRRAYES